VGETVWEPETATAAPLRVAEVALLLDHVMTDVLPEIILVGLAAMISVGTGFVEVTVSRTFAEAVVPLLLVATRVRSSDAVGAMVFVPEVATATPLRVVEAAFRLLQVTTVFLPLGKCGWTRRNECCDVAVASIRD